MSNRHGEGFWVEEREREDLGKVGTALEHVELGEDAG